MRGKAWDELTIDDLPTEDLRWIAKKHGIYVARDIWMRRAGSSFSLPIRLPKAFCIRYIREHWNGSNADDLAGALNIHVRTVYNYMCDYSQAKSNVQQLQLSL